MFYGVASWRGDNLVLSRHAWCLQASAPFGVRFVMFWRYDPPFCFAADLTHVFYGVRPGQRTPLHTGRGGS